MTQEVIIVGSPEDNSKSAIATLEETRGVLKEFKVSLHIIDDDADKVEQLSNDIVQNKNLKVLILQNALFLDPKKTFELTNKIKSLRPDIFLTTIFHTEQDLENIVFVHGMFFLKKSNSDLVCLFGSKKTNIVLAPEEAKYHTSIDGKDAFKGMLNMINSRVKNTYPVVHTNVKNEDEDYSASVEHNLLGVVQYCMNKECFCAFQMKTQCSFACRTDEPKVFVYSNNLIKYKDTEGTAIKKFDQLDLSMAESVSETEINVLGEPCIDLAVFNKLFIEHPEIDCILHLHVKDKYSGIGCGLKPTIIYNKENCADSLESADKISKAFKDCKMAHAVYVDSHGAYVGFNKSTSIENVVQYLESNFHLTEESTKKTVTTSTTSNSTSKTSNDSLVISEDLANILKKSTEQFTKGLSNTQLVMMYNDLRAEVVKRKQENKEFFKSTDSYKESKKEIDELCKKAQEIANYDQVVVQAEITFGYNLTQKEIEFILRSALNKGRSPYLTPEITIDQVTLVSAFRRLEDSKESAVEDITWDETDKEEIAEILEDRLNAIDFNEQENYDKYEREIKYLFPERFEEINKIDSKGEVIAKKISKVLKDTKNTELE